MCACRTLTIRREASEPSESGTETAETPQVSKYWKRYGLVVVTNYRDFVLIGRDEAGQPLRLEIYRMAESERDFHALLANPRKASDEQGERLLEFLRRVLLYEAALADPEDLAWFPARAGSGPAVAATSGRRAAPGASTLA